MGALPLPPQANAQGTPASLKVKIVAIGDFHGNLLSPGSERASPSSPLVAAGGAEYLATYVNKLKAQNPLNVVVSAGDLTGDSPPISSLFFDEPAIEVMNRVGLEFSAAGASDFDRGADELIRLKEGGCVAGHGDWDSRSCKGFHVGTHVPFEGAKFRWLSSNVTVSASNRPLLAPYAIKTFGGVRVGFIGATASSTPNVVPASGISGLDFGDEADAINQTAATLRASGVSSIVVLLNQGGVQTGAVPDISACSGNLAGSPVAGIVKRLSDSIDLVISGHTRAAYSCRIANAVGRQIPVTQANAYGQGLTDIDVSLDPRTGRVISVSAVNRLVDHTVQPNLVMLLIVTAYRELAALLMRDVVGSITQSVPVTSDAACNMPAGELIADAQLAAGVPREISPWWPPFKRPDPWPPRDRSELPLIAFANRSDVLAPGFVYAQSGNEGNGNVTYSEVFAVLPSGERVVTMTLTAQDIKNALEQQFAGCRGQAADTTRIMSPSAGFKYTWDSAQACDARIKNVTLTAFGTTETLVDAAGALPFPDKTYRVAVNRTLAVGGDGFSTFLRGQRLKDGPSGVQAVVSYFGNFKKPNPPYSPTAVARATPRILRSGGAGDAICPTGAIVATSPPIITDVTPQDVTTADNKPPILALFASESPLATASLHLLVDGIDVTPRAVATATSILYSPTTPLADGLHSATLSFSDVTGRIALRNWSFTVQAATPPAVSTAGDRGVLTTPLLYSPN